MTVLKLDNTVPNQSGYLHPASCSYAAATAAQCPRNSSPFAAFFILRGKKQQKAQLSPG